MKNLRYLLLLTIVFWLLGFYYMFSGYSNNSSDSDDSKKDNSHKLISVIQNLEKELSNLEDKYRKNDQLIQDLSRKARDNENHNNNNDDNHNPRQINQVNNNGPSLLHEDLRRKIYDDVKDVSFFVESQIESINNKLKKPDDDLTENIEHLKEDFRDRINFILSNLHNLSLSDKMGEWRQSESMKLGIEVQEKFKRLQNPSNCEASKKIICDLNKACGFGCQIHHIMYCFIVSFFTNRVMILESNGWRYNSAGYEAYFEPLSQTCTKTDDKAVQWNGIYYYFYS